MHEYKGSYWTMNIHVPEQSTERDETLYADVYAHACHHENVDNAKKI